MQNTLILALATLASMASALSMSPIAKRAELGRRGDPDCNLQCLNAMAFCSVDPDGRDTAACRAVLSCQLGPFFSDNGMTAAETWRHYFTTSDIKGECARACSSRKEFCHYEGEIRGACGFVGTDGSC